ncbi:NAD(P)/FAD-dependent oxidoreductase [Salipiger abyssi]|uniref:FAD/NAD(P)-dependent oxidoreductase n=1 Tax=Salipiger abyssi TaxID=1250539 RepID=UPI001A8FC357|nr:NAD(P)/FAD-dependent oxidoreductase [Salipiger abyssi]MBN9886932.1 FAD-dependent oxidoreductase [Salipiger abyssi]
MGGEPIVAIVGAGPAGLAATRVLVQAGLRPIVLEEATLPGGQGTRRLSPLSEPYRAALYGQGADAMARREDTENAILAKCDYRPGTLVWACHDNQLELLGPDGFVGQPYTHLVIAVGATDRIMPVPGWTLPGVFTLGGSQVAVKRHASFIGRKVVFAGSSPLLYLAAAQYLRLGHRDLTVLDTTPMAAKLRAFPAMLRHAPRTAMEGLALMAELRRGGVAMLSGGTIRAIEGDGRVERLRYVTRKGRETVVAADAVAMGHGLRAETQLAELAGAEFRFDPDFRQWFARTDAMGRAGETLWLAGDSARIGGAQAADAAGSLAAQSLLASLGRQIPARLLRRGRRRLKAQLDFQRAMTGAFRWPAETVAELPDATPICRCERVTAGEIRATLAAPVGPVEINRVKSITRCGMGRCQGRFCGPALAEIVASAAGETPGRLRAQAPVRPIPLVADTEGAEQRA